MRPHTTRGCENLRVPALLHPGRWWLPATFGAAAAGVGLLAGIDPRLAIGAAVSLAFLLLVLADLYVGLLLFTVLSFAAQVPNVAGPAVSVVKVIGLLLAISWLATLVTRREAASDFMSAHPGLTYLVVLFLSWTALSQLWAEAPGDALTEFSRLNEGFSQHRELFRPASDVDLLEDVTHLQAHGRRFYSRVAWQDFISRRQGGQFA